MNTAPPASYFLDNGFVSVDMPTPGAMGSPPAPRAGETDHANLGNTFIDPQDKFWSLYLSDAEKYDKLRIESWKGDTEGILIFTGLFAATVATFTVASYSMLFPDPTQHTAALLTMLIALSVNGSQAIVIPAPPVFQASTAAVCINALWIISLFLALACALAATLVQQWTRCYAHRVQRRAPPHIRGPVHVVLVMGLRRFGMKQAVAAIICTLHISVGLFLAGLGVYMSSANDTIAFVVGGVMGIGTLGYGFLSVLPLACTDSPYKTPFTPVLRLGVTFVCAIPVYCCALAAKLLDFARLFTVSRQLKGQREWLEKRGTAISCWTKTLKGERIKYARDLAKVPTVAREKFALRQTMKDLDEIHELESFCDALLVVVQPVEGTRWDLEPPKRAELVMHLLSELRINDRIGQLISSRPSTTSEPSIRGMRSRRLIVGLRLSRALTSTIALEGHADKLVETIRRTYQPLLQTWKSIALNEKHPETAFLARCFLAAVRADVCDHQLSMGSTFTDSVYLAAELAPAGSRELPGELAANISASLRVGTATNTIHSYMCHDYVHLLRDILQFDFRARDLLDAHAGTWLSLFMSNHLALCTALKGMDDSCLDELHAVLMHVNMCHRQASGELFARASDPAGQGSPDDEYRLLFSRYPELAGALYVLWTRIKMMRPNRSYYCTCYHHLHQQPVQHPLECTEISMTTDSSITLPLNL